MKVRDTVYAHIEHPCGRTFYTKEKLMRHMDSTVHQSYMFHCPTGLPGVPELEQRRFIRLGSLIQHIERGVCNGGSEGMRAVADMVQKLILEKMGISVTLLD